MKAAYKLLIGTTLLSEDWAKRIVIRQFNIKHIHDHIISFQKELLSKIHSEETLLSIPNNFHFRNNQS